MSAESDKYEVLEKIGHGSFGVIRRVRRKADGMILCRKEISYLKMSQKEREQLHAEFQILSTLRHPNIVGYYHREHLKATQDLHLYMEYCGNGDLGRVIKDLAGKNQFAEEAFVWSIFAQLVTALYRCHYGVDPPEVGKSVLGLGKTANPKAPAGGMTILHRDLKPENVFLGEDNSVKLGDFGLSKMIQSHDFASTYVGTPFYMSPEICAAEKYTLKSDIWSLGCIIYELCTKEPPFNAKSHFQLVQKIKEGRFSPLPAVYSSELAAVIRDCLRVNPDRRPDTAALLNLPLVRLMRKEKEVVDCGRALKAKEEALARRMREVDQRLTSVEVDRIAMRQEVDSSLRREWEVKARLEIDRLVNQEIEQLQRKFEEEVAARVEVEIQRALREQHQQLAQQHQQQMLALQQQLQSQKKTVSFHSHLSGNDSDAGLLDFSSSLTKSDYPHSSVGAGDGDFPSSTDLTELSIDSPRGCEEPQPAAAPQPRKAARTPFARAQTMFVGHAGAGTPMDVEMASPSPMAIGALSLSPRRNAATKAPVFNSNNIFSSNNGQATSGSAERWESLMNSDDDEDANAEDDDDDDDECIIPSPTRMVARSGKSNNPFTSKQRPTLHAKNSGPLFLAPGAPRLQSKQGALSGLHAKGMASNPDLASNIRAVPSSSGLRGGIERAPSRGRSPNRRLSKIPSAANLLPGGSSNSNAAGNTSTNSNGSEPGGAPTGTGGLTRNPSVSKKEGGSVAGGSSSENQQPASTSGSSAPSLTKLTAGIKGRTLVELQQARAGGRPVSVAEGTIGMSNLNLNSSPKRAFREHAAAANRGGSGSGTALALEPPAVWDPEKDEMPSPFLVRRKPLGRV